MGPTIFSRLLGEFMFKSAVISQIPPTLNGHVEVQVSEKPSKYNGVQ